MSKKHTKHDQLLIAVGTMIGPRTDSFNEFDLTVTAWKLYPHSFGLRGYEDLYPDHKRVTTEVLIGVSRSKTFQKEARPNQYSLSPIGIVRLIDLESSGLALRAIRGQAFAAWNRDPSLPRESSQFVRELSALSEICTREEVILNTRMEIVSILSSKKASVELAEKLSSWLDFCHAMILRFPEVLDFSHESVQPVQTRSVRANHGPGQPEAGRHNGHDS